MRHVDEKDVNLPMKVTVVPFPGSMISGIGTPIDIFGSVEVLWGKITGEARRSPFDVKLATPGGRTITCLGGLGLSPNVALEDVDETDLVVVTGFRLFEGIEEYLPVVLDWLVKTHGSGAHIASICTGAFVMAEAGLLDGKTATTHWGLADVFERRFPKVHLKPHRIITDEGDLFCSGGVTAGMDLCFYLVSKYCGKQAAAQCARAMVHDFSRKSQAPYSISWFQREHPDAAVRKAQEKLEREFAKALSVKHLAREAAMTERTFERRFKAATGDTPKTYLQRVRVERARQLLEAGDETFERITFQVGYEDPSSFRRLFSRMVGLTPMEYRSRFTMGPV